MPSRLVRLPRREFLLSSLRTGFTAAGIAAMSPAALAELLATPSMTEGPFYPDRLPLDTDNDLLIVNEATAHGLGDITHLTGRVLSRAGEPVRNAVVEIWQVDNNGAYLHSADRNAERDKNFQGYGRFLTDSSGAYYFRTIKPVPYPGRTPHIHFAVSQNGQRVLTTQLFVAGQPQNERDGVLRSVGGEAERKLLMGDFRKIEGSPLDEYEVEFNLTLGRTPAEGDDGQFPGVIAKSRGGFGGPGGRRGGPPPRQ
ncbi:Protocatechuate 3,4-dioxygenase beta chain [Botrimarina colliarenosi]|uniref:Protocatechuate 3,4-dioxygenase beta chain n=1 Tax=Botrimarina colliarenosi TaxID=2528001 RepID=A0A5C6AL78_9BACT|nr:protocatechuate 3,4-dioxygenase [Botrimarina colliarenosi]TWU00217.1 Protocatechuate 3,4-dioxygenase beta chain [Botrimarina colliarenosi]